MIFLLHHGGFLSSQIMGNEIRKYIINGIIENGHFFINVLSIKSSFPVKFINGLLNRINIRFFTMPDFTFIGKGEGRGGYELLG